VRALLQVFLIPLGFIYALAAWFRRQYFQRLNKRKKSAVFTIAVGNLAVGGTGKTPMALYLAQHTKNSTAMLSRGYKRKTKGFREVQLTDDAALCGDEPLEMKIANPNLPIFVCEKRLEGIVSIQKLLPQTETVILDDAFQHLPLLANKYVLLTDFNLPFYKDWPMPAGRLREFACTASQADVIVVTKCPIDLHETEADRIRRHLEKYDIPVFFCHYENADPENALGNTCPSDAHIMVVSGLANNDAFQTWAKKWGNVKVCLGYPDHYNFKPSDYSQWQQTLLMSEDTVILTTRKDFARMQGLPDDMKRRIFMTFTTPKFLFQQEDAFLRILFN
jgi:tetraacyldisaccharide 4'-kinase